MHIPQELSPSMATHSNEPQFPRRSPGPACQSCRVLRLLQSLQVDSLMLQEWFILQLSWPGNPHQGRGDMAAQPQHPATALCPPRRPSTLQGTSTLLQREAKAESSTLRPATPRTQPWWESTLVPFYSLHSSPKPQRTLGIHKRSTQPGAATHQTPTH